MPDWRNADDYAYAEKLTYRQWAWEFLRRSDAFRNLWKRINEFLKEQDKRGLKIGDPVELPAWLFYGGSEFGLGNQTPGPDVPAYEVPNLKWRLGLDLKMVRLSDFAGRPEVAIFGFNLALPIDGQIEEARRELEILKQEYDESGQPSAGPLDVRLSKDRGIKYLRLLDAKLAGASIGEMGRVLFAHTANPRLNALSSLKTAREFADHKYRQLLLISDPNAPHARPEEPPIPTPLVHIALGSDWNKNPAGAVVTVDAKRGAWILENIAGSEPADEESAGHLKALALRESKRK